MRIVVAFGVLRFNTSGTRFLGVLQLVQFVLSTFRLTSKNGIHGAPRFCFGRYARLLAGE